MLDCDSVGDLLRHNVSLITQCDTTTTGVLRIATEFRYPDGSHVDIFLQEDHATYLLSDLGETTAYLVEYGIEPWKSRKRRTVINDVCRLLRVRQDGSQFQIQVAEHDHKAFADAVLRLAQACIRISDIALGVTYRASSDFREQVEDSLEASRWPYSSDYIALGVKGNEVQIDFKVEGPNRISLVQTMTAANEATARRRAQGVFAKWYDIRQHKTDTQQFLTVCDSSTDVFSDAELRRIQDFSSLIRFPANEQAFLEALAA